MKRSATIGGAVWIGLAGLAWWNRADLDWIDRISGSGRLRRRWE